MCKSWLLFFVAFSGTFLAKQTLSKTVCPISIKPPCVCISPASIEGVPSIKCKNATESEITKFMDEIPRDIEIDNLTIIDSPIPRLSPFSFGGRISVHRLIFNRNGLSLIHTLFFVNNVALDLLEELDLSENLLTEAPRMVHRMENVKVVKLRKNRISRLSSGTFENLSKLRIVDLSENSIEFMDYKALKNLPALTKVDLSHNKLQMIGPGVMEGAFARRDIKGRSFILCGNPWVCDDRLAWLRLWLRGQRDIIIDGEKSCKSVCSEPHWLKNWPLRSPDPKFQIGNSVETDRSKDDGKMYSILDAKPVFDFLEWVLGHFRLSARKINKL